MSLVKYNSKYGTFSGKLASITVYDSDLLTYVQGLQTPLSNDQMNKINTFIVEARWIEENLVKDEKIEQIIKDKKIPVNVLAVVVNRAVPKDDVMEELTRTAIQIQAQETQEQREKTESKREAAEIKRAQADKAYQREMSIAADQYIKLRALEIEKEKVEMIKNKQNVKINMLMGNGAQPIYDVNY